MGVNGRPAAFVSHLSLIVDSRQKRLRLFLADKNVCGCDFSGKAGNTQASQTKGRLADDRTDDGTNGENARYTS